MEAPALISRHRRPFLLPVWLSFAAVFGLFLAALVAFFLYRSASTTTVVVLARHAEKDLSSIQDPPLSAEGEQRAERLAQMFGRSKGVGRIDAIYVSDARRTQQTAAPLAERLGKHAVVVPAADTKGLVTRVMHEHEGGTVLIIGHSNTVPELIHELGDIDVPPFGDDEYDTLYVLSIPSFGQASLLRMEY
ncbi:MAG TPA: phosphoglycerate mutase family protein [Steroidobacteraceae bacterium]|jgi:broad specificity phosphatase PhoE|nr:phosphoglycerate mutase family protein [Steroidobacteraceae bacterium]